MKAKKRHYQHRGRLQNRVTMKRVEGRIDPSDVPAYSLADGARILGVHPSMLHRWYVGYAQGVDESSIESLVKGKPRERRELSFIDLIELLCIREFKSRGFSTQRIRKLSDYVSNRTNVDHPFARHKFYTLGRNVFFEQHRGSERFLYDPTAADQSHIRDIVVALAHKLDFSGDIVARYWPEGRDAGIAIDPRVSYGQPSIAGNGVRTWVIYDCYLAEKEDLAKVASCFDVSLEQARAAVKYEQHLTAA